MTYQRLGHDDADLALGHGGEVGEQALEDVLARLALRVDADGHHGWRTLLSLRTADRRDGGFIVSVPHGRRCGNDTKSTRWETGLSSENIANSSTNEWDGISHTSVDKERSPNRALVRSFQTWT